jgi:alpha-beta hydrolase superfamily lysophospholipase
MWANTIASHGIAVLRYDQRFITHTINLSEFTLSDRINDIIAAISYLKSRSEINTGKIFIVGHSQGGCIAPVAAQRENSVLGVGIINSDAIAIDTLIIERLKARGLPTSYISDILDKFELLRTNTFSPEWEYSNRGAIYWKEWIEYTEKADSITVSLGKPILIIQGSDDETYTPLTYQKNLSKWESISNQSSLIDLKIYEGVTHLVLKSGTQQTETQVLHDLITWIRQYDQLLE